MTNEEVIELAKEAGLNVDGDYFSDAIYRALLVRFANLVAEKEREACAKLVDYWEAREGEHADAIRARGQA